MTEKRPRRREQTGLTFDARRGTWLWRRVHPTTGKRLVRSTGQRRFDLAMRQAAKFEDELRAELAGVPKFDGWRLELAPLVPVFLERQERELVRKTFDQKKRELERALEQLRLRTAADLLDLAALDDRLRALERHDVTRTMMRRSYQQPLRQFTRWLAGNGRHLDRDPLASWEPIEEATRPTSAPAAEARRGFLPLEVARALAAIDVLDARRGRPSQRLMFVVLLVTAPRATAFLTRDVRDFDLGDRRIDFGAAVRHKRRGAGRLDPSTAQELAAAIGDRKAGPLFLSPTGKRWTKERLLDAWREAFALGVVDQLWPRDVPQDLDLAVLVARSLVAGRVSVSRGGNPALVTDGTRSARAELAGRVEAVVARMRETWAERMAGVDVHAARRTHRMWARARHVLGEAIDAQLGHDGHEDAATSAVLRAAAGSRTGRLHYMDEASPLFDPATSAQAVRDVLEDARAELAASGSLLLPRATSAAARPLRSSLPPTAGA